MAYNYCNFILDLSKQYALNHYRKMFLIKKNDCIIVNSYKNDINIYRHFY